MTNAEDISVKSFAAPAYVFEKYSDTVYRLAFVRTKSRSDSDDILQEVFLRYMRIWRNMQSEEHVKATLIRIAINRSNSWLSSAWFRRTAPLDESIPADCCFSCENALGEVLKLPLKYRTVIHLHYYMGYSTEEIARITESNPSNVKTRLARAREMLKKTIKADDI